MKRDVSSSLTRGINAKRLCTRLKKKDGQMCELKYDKKFDPKTVRLPTQRRRRRKRRRLRHCCCSGAETRGRDESAAASRGRCGVAYRSRAIVALAQCRRNAARTHAEHGGEALS